MAQTLPGRHARHVSSSRWWQWARGLAGQPCCWLSFWSTGTSFYALWAAPARQSKAGRSACRAAVACQPMWLDEVVPGCMGPAFTTYQVRLPFVHILPSSKSGVMAPWRTLGVNMDSHCQPSCKLRLPVHLVISHKANLRTSPDCRSTLTSSRRSCCGRIPGSQPEFCAWACTS